MNNQANDSKKEEYKPYDR